MPEQDKDKDKDQNKDKEPKPCYKCGKAHKGPTPYCK